MGGRPAIAMVAGAGLTTGTPVAVACKLPSNRVMELNHRPPRKLPANKPVVAYDFDGASEVCLDNQTRFLVRLDHENAAVERILLLARDPNLRAEFGERGRKLVLENSPVEKMVETFYRLYQDLLTGIRP
jgi:hypothetical protein